MVKRKATKTVAGQPAITPIVVATPEQLARRAASHPGLSAEAIEGKARHIRDTVAAQHRAVAARIADLSRPSNPGLAPAERWQRGAEGQEEPLPGEVRPTQRADSGLQQLRRTDKIGDRELVAATRWRGDYELGACGARDPAKSGSGGGVDGYNISAIDALTRYWSAKAAVGGFGDSLLVAFVSDGLSLNAIARSLEAERAAAEKAGRPTGGTWSRQDLTGALVVVLTRLGEHYAEIDALKAKDLPPWERSRVQDERRTAYGQVWRTEVDIAGHGRAA